MTDATRENEAARIIFKKMIHPTNEWMSNFYDQDRAVCFSAARAVLDAPASELTAAYERIEELEVTLKAVRDALRDGTDPFDIIEHCVEIIDDELTDKTVLAA